MVVTLWRYWRMAIGPERLAAVRPVPGWAEGAATAAITALAVWWVADAARRRDWKRLIAPAWFLSPWRRFCRCGTT